MYKVAKSALFLLLFAWLLLVYGHFVDPALIQFWFKIDNLLF